MGDDPAVTEDDARTAAAAEEADELPDADVGDPPPAGALPADDPPVDAGHREARRVMVPLVAVALSAAALIAAVAGAGLLGWQVWQQHQIEQARTDVQRAAVSYAEVLTSIDSNQVDDNFRQVLDGATGDFKDMYSKSSVELRQLLIENKATAHGVVVESAVQSVSKDKAVVLLFVDQSVSNMKLPDPRIDRSRMKMTLEKVDGRWRASKVELP